MITNSATRSRKHADEHDAGACPLECLTTADEFRARADDIEARQMVLFGMLDDRERAVLLRAAQSLADVNSGRVGSEYRDEAYAYAAKCARLKAVVGELLDLVGLLPEE